MSYPDGDIAQKLGKTTVEKDYLEQGVHRLLGLFDMGAKKPFTDDSYLRWPTIWIGNEARFVDEKTRDELLACEKMLNIIQNNE